MNRFIYFIISTIITIIISILAVVIIIGFVDTIVIIIVVVITVIVVVVVVVIVSDGCRSVFYNIVLSGDAAGFTNTLALSVLTRTRKLKVSTDKLKCSGEVMYSIS
jgi:Mn2+/Fe2+ NRAMP family transporter